MNTFWQDEFGRIQSPGEDDVLLGIAHRTRLELLVTRFGEHLAAIPCLLWTRIGTSEQKNVMCDFFRRFRLEFSYKH